tara:strand:+ start:7938 stop:8948 length:1011 start_codon:yes stop_codon:yes gene_type:complete
MKHLIVLLAFFLISNIHAATCTSISRTNSASLSVLTSTKYNTDLNTSYTAINQADGGCIQSGTLESDALNTTQFATLLKGIQQGCKVIYSNASTVQIDKCLASVNGNFVGTTTTTNASFGCTGCSSEVASTAYYVYIQTGSSGTTLTPLILTTAPNNDGYDNSGNKVLGRFYNKGNSDIDQYSIDQWLINRFVPTNTDWSDCGLVAADFTSFGSVTSIEDVCKRIGRDLISRVKFTTGTSAGTTAVVNVEYGGISLQAAPVAIIPSISPHGVLYEGQNVVANESVVLATAGLATINFGPLNTTGASPLSARPADEICGSTTTCFYESRIPIEGWNE